MSKELRHKRGQLIDAGRAILDKAKEEKRELSAEERANYNKMWEEQRALKEQIEIEERQAQLDKENDPETRQAALEAELRKRQQKPETPVPGEKLEDRSKADAEKAKKEQRRLVNEYLLGNITDKELRGLQADLAVKGGYLIAPSDMSSELIADVTNETVIRGLCSVITLTKAVSLGFPRLRTRMAAASWSSELANASEDTALDFGKREFFPHPGSAFAKVSEDLMRLAAISPENIVRSEIARVRAELEENAFLTGDGQKKPLGLFTASNDGIDTSRDVATDNASDAPTFNGLKRAKHKIKPQYRPRAKWLMHDDLVMLVSMIKDGNGQYIWKDSVQEGEPDRLLGSPVVVSMFAPNTFTANQYVAIYGDFSQYQIVDSLELEIKRLEEVFYATNEVGFLARFAVDGAPKKAEAFSRVKLGA